MEFKNCSFDYVIDKGTLDAITNSLRDKSASVRVSISRTLQEIQRVDKLHFKNTRLTFCS